MWEEVPPAPRHLAVQPDTELPGEKGATLRQGSPREQMSVLRFVAEWNFSGRTAGWNFPEGLLRGFQRFLN